ncbi:hypothetical protein FGO68_gene7776 [Halteria grandinella]|uniref:Uncharacterized protein n=1 Tax=Halteria grandinella TaxID=5974 RepID=A0A8J8TA84_HALGN|nr:hypothetical protein FGO68_gene7776 [Halteria grandinella]
MPLSSKRYSNCPSIILSLPRSSPKTLALIITIKRVLVQAASTNEATNRASLRPNTARAPLPMPPCNPCSSAHKVNKFPLKKTISLEAMQTLTR